MRALIVDDDPDSCWLLEKALEREGCQAAVAATGEQALEWVKCGEPFSMAFIDVNLPDMDGLELARLAKETAPCMAVVVTSAGSYQEDKMGKTIAEGLEQGIYDGFIGRPFDVSEVIFMVKQMMGTL